VFNRGYGGYTTRTIRAILPHVFPQRTKESAFFTTILLGSNDGMKKSVKGPTMNLHEINKEEANFESFNETQSMDGELRIK
jgi:hypothetical protein